MCLKFHIRRFQLYTNLLGNVIVQRNFLQCSMREFIHVRSLIRNLQCFCVLFLYNSLGYIIWLYNIMWCTLKRFWRSASARPIMLMNTLRKMNDQKGLYGNLPNETHLVQKVMYI